VLFTQVSQQIVMPGEPALRVFTPKVMAPKGVNLSGIVRMASHMAFEVFCRCKAFNFILAILKMALERPIVCSLMFAAERSVETLKDIDQGGAYFNRCL
jgi:hypothetical protein